MRTTRNESSNVNFENCPKDILKDLCESSDSDEDDSYINFLLLLCKLRLLDERRYKAELTNKTS